MLVPRWFFATDRQNRPQNSWASSASLNKYVPAPLGIDSLRHQSDLPMPVEPPIRRLLLCASAEEKLEPFRVRLGAAGVEVDGVIDADAVCGLLWSHHYDAVAVDLLLSDRDGISFALDLRREHPWLRVLVISTAQSPQRVDRAPDWLSRSTDHARLIFALKQAGQRAAGRAPKILHVEDDDDLASLVQNTIGKQTQLFRARSAQEARIAMRLRDYDLALMRSPISHTASYAEAQACARSPLHIETSGGDPVLTILNNLRSQPLIHEPAHC
jgi:DNA-binding NtrC family response regulator